MRSLFITLFCFCTFLFNLNAQSQGTVKGTIIDADTRLPLVSAKISIGNFLLQVHSNSSGEFNVNDVPIGELVLTISCQGYVSQNFPIEIATNEILNLGTIFLTPNQLQIEISTSLISLTEDDLNNDDYQAENTTGLLQASRDIFQNRAAFDFGQAFFRVRGYDSQNSQVLINGINMNKLFNGRPQWSNWGGLNDVTRSQELSIGLTPSNYTFGDVLGATNISMRATSFRHGLRISSSYSNKTYSGRGMITYSSGLQKNKLAYTISASRRWGNEGFIDGTSYDALGLFGALEYKIGAHNSLSFIALYTPNKRGSMAAITERVYEELGRKYNPYWGIQNSHKRNSRIKSVEEPIVMLSHFYESENTSLTTSIAYQTGKQGRSRLDYANAPNPNPNYWRYLSNIAEKPQIDWQDLYDANRNSSFDSDNGASRYLLYEDRTDDNLLTVSSILNTKVTERISFDIGGSYKNLLSDNFGKPLDLLGANYYVDENPFTLIQGHPSRNDVLSEINKGLNDRIKYNYTILSSQLNGFTQLRFTSNIVDFSMSGSYTITNHQRDGKFLNESFEDNSFGKSEAVSFNDLSAKGSLTYKFSGRHLILVNGGYLSKAPLIRNSFVNSRENNNIVANLQSEKITSVDANYIFRSPKIKSRITAYLTEFKEGTDINFLFAQVGSGTDFFQEVITNIDKQHVGAELGFEYQASPTVKTFLVAAYGKHVYSDNANVSINFDTAGFNNDVINDVGFKDLGESIIKDMRVANGPQQAYSVGIEYRDPRSWWFGATANYLSNSYIDISTIMRTSDFFINPDDPLGLPIDEIDMNLANELLKQEEFPGFYLLNITGGKSWRIKGHYLSLFVSINNVFETIYRTGGYEQARTANYIDLVEDTLNGNDERNFGNKYWYGLGRSYFINLSFNF